MTNQLNYEKIGQQLLHKPKEICQYLNLPFNEYPNRIGLKCPVHNGKDDDKCVIFTKGQTAIGNWVCWSGNCHVKYGRDIVGFVRGVLSSRFNREVGRAEVINNLAKLISENDSIQTYSPDSLSQFEIKSPVDCIETVSRKQVISSLSIPSKHYIERGYSSEILKKYDVGECYTKGRQMFLRAVVPVYDFSYGMVGCTGRSIQPECEKCGYFHFENLPCPKDKYEKYRHSKWINSKGFAKTSYLYNLSYAKNEINKKKTAILVEGPGDVWRLEEADVKNSLALFGLSLNKTQLSILENLSIENLIILTDNDDRGKQAKTVIAKQCARLFNLIYPNIPGKDVGDLSVKQIKQIEELYE